MSSTVTRRLSSAVSLTEQHGGPGRQDTIGKSRRHE